MGDEGEGGKVKGGLRRPHHNPLRERSWSLPIRFTHRISDPADGDFAAGGHGRAAVGERFRPSSPQVVRGAATKCHVDAVEDSAPRMSTVFWSVSCQDPSAR